MDAGQIWGCFFVGGILMIAVEFVDSFCQEHELSNRARKISVYLTFVLGVGITFLLGLSIGRQ